MSAQVCVSVLKCVCVCACAILTLLSLCSLHFDHKFHNVHLDIVFVTLVTWLMHFTQTISIYLYIFIYIYINKEICKHDIVFNGFFLFVFVFVFSF